MTRVLNELMDTVNASMGHSSSGDEDVIRTVDGE
jgi:hypothetical protein